MYVQVAEWQACGSHSSGPDDILGRPQQGNVVIKRGPIKAVVAAHLLHVVQLRVLGVGARRNVVVPDQNIKLASVGVVSVGGDAVSSCQHIALVDCTNSIMDTFS